MSVISRVDAFLRLAPKGPKLCKICGSVAPVFGAVDFSKSCAEKDGVVLPASGVAVDYNRCEACGFLFSAALDGWGKKDFAAKIYDEGYLKIDPDFVSVRPTASAAFLANLFAQHKSSLRVLDYGGGDGALARLLPQAGFADAETYDPLVSEFATLPEGKFPLVCSFETLEHSPDPLATFREIERLLDEPGLAVFSTVLQPDDIDKQQLGWWYASPRNGHVSLFSRRSLELALRQVGLRYGSFSPAAHVAFRKIPDFARHLFPAA